MSPHSVFVHIAGERYVLPVREVAPGTSLGMLMLCENPELTERAGRELARIMPEDVNTIVMPDGKAQALMHVVGRETDLACILLRKEKRAYMVEPVLSVSATSVTSQRVHQFYVDAQDAEWLSESTVVILDDVVSSGGTIRAVKELMEKCGVKKVYVMAVATEGPQQEDVIALTHLEVFGTEGQCDPRGDSRG